MHRLRKGYFYLKIILDISQFYEFMFVKNIEIHILLLDFGRVDA